MWRSVLKITDIFFCVENIVYLCIVTRGCKRVFVTRCVTQEKSSTGNLLKTNNIQYDEKICVQNQIKGFKRILYVIKTY